MKILLKSLLYFSLIFTSELAIAQTESDIEEQIFIHLERARDLKDILDYKEALIHCNEALDLSTQINDKENEATTYRIIGSILMLDNNLEEALLKAHTYLTDGGRIGVISFHSIEDRIVKRTFREWQRKQTGVTLAKKPITPSAEELKENQRARSAKLRFFEKQ